MGLWILCQNALNDVAGRVSLSCQLAVCVLKDGWMVFWHLTQEKCSVLLSCSSPQAAASV